MSSKRNALYYETCPRSQMPLRATAKCPIYRALKDIRDNDSIAVKIPYKGSSYTPARMQIRAHDYAERMGFKVETSKDSEFIYIAKRDMHDTR